MTLHEAIEKLLLQTGRQMTITEIAKALNENEWYRKKDGSEIESSQIHLRTRKYSRLFNRNGNNVTLIGSQIQGTKLTKVTKAVVVSKPLKDNIANAKTSFEPISNSETSILILGTMPGDASLVLGEYYGHSRNRFWKVISSITDNELPHTYAEKKALLLKLGIAVWDVAKKANRVGSLDSEIKDEEPNDIEQFIIEHKNLKTIGFNGKKSETLYNKYFSQKSGYNYVSLPSTSPAHTSMSFEILCTKWKQILNAE